jgi:hypothetical protein
MPWLRSESGLHLHCFGAHICQCQSFKSVALPISSHYLAESLVICVNDPNIHPLPQQTCLYEPGDKHLALHEIQLRSLSLSHYPSTTLLELLAATMSPTEHLSMKCKTYTVKDVCLPDLYFPRCHCWRRWCWQGISSLRTYSV